MTTKEAIQAMLDGKKVRVPRWVNDRYICFENDQFRDKEGSIFSEFAYYGYDWEIYEEPKPKQIVTIEKWLMSYSSDNRRTIIVEGSTEEIEYWLASSWKQVKLLDTYEVEL